RQIVTNDLIPILGKIRLERLSAGEVEYLLRAKRQAGQSPRTVFHLRAVLRSALNHARRQELIFKNVAELAQPPRVPHRPVKPLDPEQAGRLLEAAKGDRLSALYSVALALGLRQGEILGLRRDEVDLTAGTMHVVHGLQRIGGEMRLVEVKTRGSHRTLHLPESILGELREHRQRQNEERLAARYWEDSGLVFTTEYGAPLDGDRMRRHFLQLLEKAGLPRMRFYDLRHSCASLLLAQGVPLRSIMELLGHSSIALTANTYTHLLPALQKETAQAWDTLSVGFRQAR
ncbi:MAG: tyrosine-type recombinase/integrase, partial [Candidatus Dormibacteraceae bacterium]